MSDMTNNMQGTPRPILLPTEINWICVIGPVLEYRRRTAAELVASGLLTPDEIPLNRTKRSREGALDVNLAKGGTYNVRVRAESVLARDVLFKRFIGDLLSDTRLSLVKGESRA